MNDDIEGKRPITIAAPVAGGIQRQGSPLEVLLVFFKLGVSCFGGPIAMAYLTGPLLWMILPHINLHLATDYALPPPLTTRKRMSALGKSRGRRDGKSSVCR